MRGFLTLALFAALLSAGCFQEDALNNPSPGAPGVEGSEQTAAVVPEEPETETVKAEAGVTGKGDYGRGLYSTPLSAYWKMRERITYDFQVQSTLNLYKGTNGHAPQSHEEFMKEIIEKGQIQLPDLPQGHSYFYDPELEELRVRRPKAIPALD